MCIRDRLVTTWIDQAPRALNDYSNRQWAGLVADFYLPRWKNFFESQLDVLTGKKDRAAAQAAFMDKTVREDLAFAGNGKVYSTKSSGDALAVANRVTVSYTHLDVYKRQESLGVKRA